MLISAGLVMPMGSALAQDPAIQFARFWAAALAVEDRCEKYSVLTDAVMGSHLAPEDYQRAQVMVEVERPKMAKTMASFTCQRAAEETAKLGRRPFLEVWQVEE